MRRPLLQSRGWQERGTEHDGSPFFQILGLYPLLPFVSSVHSILGNRAANWDRTEKNKSSSRRCIAVPCTHIHTYIHTYVHTHTHRPRQRVGRVLEKAEQTAGLLGADLVTFGVLALARWEPSGLTTHGTVWNQAVVMDGLVVSEGGALGLMWDFLSFNL